MVFLAIFHNYVSMILDIFDTPSPTQETVSIWISPSKNYVSISYIWLEKKRKTLWKLHLGDTIFYFFCSFITTHTYDNGHCRFFHWTYHMQIFIFTLKRLLSKCLRKHCWYTPSPYVSIHKHFMIPSSPSNMLT